ncbi:putative HNHc nuclease, partial [Selenomonas ruminantium]|uniref:putative HNHc nuclease n=1 Tax=Selenomonas ruminantium TaxID=971 RepID=UPI0026F2BBC5
MEVVHGKITTFNDDGTVVIKSAVPSIDRAILRKYSDVEIGLSDGRKISAKQRRAIYVLLGAIADFVGDTVESQKEIMKLDFILNRLQCIQRKIFSLSDVDMTTAREFQSFLVDFII